MAQVHFEPIGEDIECGAEETILDAAFRQGYNLAYGCREGQCSACKAYLLEGEVYLKKYSTFALSDAEEERGYTLLCRAMPEEDLSVELLHFDRENYRLDNPIRQGRGRVTAVEALTQDIRRLCIAVEEPADFAWTPGQYVDVVVPGEDGYHRSFSMANLVGENEIELIIKKYEGGRFSSMLDGGIAEGDELCFEGPYGSFHLRESDRDVLMVAGGSGMAPVLCLLRRIADEGIQRRVRFFYGARTESDLFYVDEIAKLGDRIPDFRFIPVLSDGESDGGWNGERGFVHDAVDRYLDTGELSEFEVYMCGPPPMIEAMQELMVEARGHDDDLLFWDKFTIAAETEGD